MIQALLLRPKYEGHGEVSSFGFWNSFPLQLLPSKLFSFIFPTSTVRCILSVFCLERGDIQESYMLYRLAESYSHCTFPSLSLTGICSFWCFQVFNIKCIVDMQRLQLTTALIDLYRVAQAKLLLLKEAFIIQIFPDGAPKLNLTFSSFSIRSLPSLMLHTFWLN